MKKILGIYKGIVTDTSEFYQSGKIRVRTSLINSQYFEEDLSVTYKADNFNAKIEKDLYCFIQIPFGGGMNNGMFRLPPVNSVGVIQFLDGNINTPVWLGGIILPETSGSLKLVDINGINLDENSEESPISLNEDGFLQKNFETDDENSFVFRLKNTSLDNAPASLSWKNNNTENILIFNKNKILIKHYGDQNSFQEITMISDEKNNLEPTINISTYTKNEDGKDIQRSSFEQTPDSFVLSNYDIASNTVTEIRNEIRTIGNKNISVLRTMVGEMNDTKRSEVTQDKDSIIASVGKSVTLIEDGEITLSAPTVRFSSDNILLGTSNQRIVVSNTEVNSRLEDGTILTTANGVSI